MHARMRVTSVWYTTVQLMVWMQSYVASTYQRKPSCAWVHLTEANNNKTHIVDKGALCELWDAVCAMGLGIGLKGLHTPKSQLMHSAPVLKFNNNMDNNDTDRSWAPYVYMAWR